MLRRKLLRDGAAGEFNDDYESDEQESTSESGMVSNNAALL